MRQLIGVFLVLFGFSAFGQIYHSPIDSTAQLASPSDSLVVETAGNDSLLTDSNTTLSYSPYIALPADTVYSPAPLPELNVDLATAVACDTFYHAVQEIDSSVFHPKKPEKIIFKVKVIDTLTGKEIPAHIFMTSITTNGKRYNGSGVTTSNGNFEIKVSEKSHFEININGPGFYTAFEEITVKNEEIKNGVIERTYQLRPLKKGDVIRLNQVNFDQGDYQLKQESIIQLTRLVALLKANPEMVIQLEGHTESTASYESSIKLSQKRVYEVRYFLVRKGIDVHRIKAIGYGNTKPLTTKTDPESQLLNRRVEFRVIKD